MDTHFRIPATTTLRNERRDFSEWHLGRPVYALWALQCDMAALLPRMQAAQEHLADLLLDGYCRQAHVTLSLCGFPRAMPQRADEFGPALIASHVLALQQAGLAAFDMEVAELDSFSSVPYFAVHAPQGCLQSLRACLGAQEFPGGDYMPHVTVGLYRDAFPLAAVHQRLRSFALSGSVHVRVTGLSLLTYAAAEIGGPLQCAASYPFDGGGDALRWHVPPSFWGA